MIGLPKGSLRSSVFSKKDVRLLAFCSAAMFWTVDTLPAQSDVDTHQLVAVKVSATDKGGAFVAGLPQSVFKVFDNGVEQSDSLPNRRVPYFRRISHRQQRKHYR